MEGDDDLVPSILVPKLQLGNADHQAPAWRIEEKVRASKTPVPKLELGNESRNQVTSLCSPTHHFFLGNLASQHAATGGLYVLMSGSDGLFERLGLAMKRRVRLPAVFAR